uniref:Uncharacterized protein n=1 Tax=Alexandrium catenella TaxID=2925 RepID=A0A7S1QEB1_ALECA|mmetsp:Transcript_29573/g.79883  ORF Transcript_29573/g.79883 Transcript_29573/m.79883 type:complete len:165 (+) Transcript_29573:158-652(+)
MDGDALRAEAGQRQLCGAIPHDKCDLAGRSRPARRGVQERYPYPITLMGDLNSGYDQPSQQLLREGRASGFGRNWNIPHAFVDAWAELHPSNPNPSTIQDFPVRLDCVYFQRSPQVMWYLHRADAGPYLIIARISCSADTRSLAQCVDDTPAFGRLFRKDEKYA